MRFLYLRRPRWPALFAPGSLGRRLLLGTLVWVLATLAISGLVLTDLFREHIKRQLRADLRVQLNQLTGHLDFSADGQPFLARPLSDPRLNQPFSGLYWQVALPDGTALLRSRSLWDGVIGLAPASLPKPGREAELRLPGPGGGRLFVLARSILPEDGADRPLVLLMAADESAFEKPVRDFAGTLAIALTLLAAGLVGAVFLQLRLAMTPLARLRQGLAAVRDGRQRQLTGNFPSEIQPLVDDFNSVLAHDTEVLERARTQAGNLAHALKTPLAILANAACAEDTPLGRLVREQIDIARRQVDYHLARARVAATAQLPGRSVPIRPLIDGLLRLMARLYEARQLEFSVVLQPDDLLFRGEAQDFQEMLGNLLDNACKWARQRVRLRASLVAGKLRIDIEDDGPGLPAARRADVLQRGTRADEAVPGSGLGLAIVHDLAQLYGGALELSASPDGGLAAHLTLPGGLPAPGQPPGSTPPSPEPESGASRA